MAGGCVLCCNLCTADIHETVCGEKTNYEGIIGKTIRITERVDNIRQTGMANVNGQEWTVRAERDDLILEPEMLAKVVNISGVKLIVKEYEEE